VNNFAERGEKKRHFTCVGNARLISTSPAERSGKFPFLRTFSGYPIALGFCMNGKAVKHDSD
jgi:hypothetical protein